MDSQDLRHTWATRSGEYDPTYYAYRGPDRRSDAVQSALEAHLQAADPSILEVGCSSGRHLSQLLAAGYESLTGVDLNPASGAVMAANFPALAEQGTFVFDAIESAVAEFGTDEFAATYSVETLHHVHPDSEWVFEELARVTGELLVTVEIEGAADGASSVTHVRDGIPLYHRDWRAIFTELGFEHLETHTIDRDTVRVFRNST